MSTGRSADRKRIHDSVLSSQGHTDAIILSLKPIIREPDHLTDSYS